MKKLLSFLLAIAVAAGVSAHPLRVFNHLGVGVAAGTNGLSFQVATPITSFVNMRAGVDIMPDIHFNTDVEAQFAPVGANTPGPTNLDVELGLGRTQGNIIFNIYPIPMCSFYIAGGAYFGGDKIVKVSGHSTELAGGNLNIGDYELPFDQYGYAKGGIKTSNFRPYVGIGWGRAVPNHLINFNLDLGVQFLGNRKLYSETGDIREIAGMDADNDIQKIMDKVSVYPVISFRISGKIF